MTKDKILIGYAPMADFSTAPWGVLKLVEGKVALDVTKAFNRARLMLNCGANMFRILRRGIWSLPVGGEFDYETPAYWDTLRQYVEILHQPTQGTWSAPGADVLIEIFDNCSEKWMYDPANYDKTRNLIRAMFSNLGDLPYVKFGMGNEMNCDEIIDLAVKVIYPEFKNAGRIPFSYAATYSPKKDWVGQLKAKASLAWNPPGAPDFMVGDNVAAQIFKQVHGICDVTEVDLITTASYWVNGCSPKLRTIWSADGVFDGASDCDWMPGPTGKIQRRPSPAQVRSTVKYILELAKDFDTPAGLPRFGFEYLPKAINADECSAKGVLAISQEYFIKWGRYPENLGKYPNDWVEPEPPEPPDPPVPPIPPEPEPEKSCYEKFIAGRPFWKWQIGKFIQCLL